MKRVGCLFEQVCSWENLWTAANRARRNKRSRPNVAEYEFQRENELLRLQNMLVRNRYRCGAYRSFQISEPKQRLISAAPYRDRVLHHAICQVIEPVWERIFIRDSYACRPQKGSMAAMKRAYEFCGNYAYVLKCDIRRFFPSVDHDVLRQQLAKKLKDRKLLDLLSDIIAHPFPGQSQPEYFPGDDLFTVADRPCGLPIGNQTSQFFGNVMLNPLDHYAKEVLRVRGYVRYADDFLIFGDNKTELAATRKLVRDFLLSFRLRIHPHKSEIFPVKSGLPFLGYRLFPGRIWLCKKHIHNLRQRLRAFETLYRTNPDSADHIYHSLQSWWGYAMHADAHRIVQDIVNDFPFVQEIGKQRKSQKNFDAAARRELPQ